MISFVMEPFKGVLHLLLKQGLLSCKPLSISLIAVFYSSPLKLFGLQGQYSSIPIKENRRGQLATFNRAGIFKKSLGARHRRGIGFSYRPARSGNHKEKKSIG
jgi:hypothetical protein